MGGGRYLHVRGREKLSRRPPKVGEELSRRPPDSGGGGDGEEGSIGAGPAMTGMRARGSWRSRRGPAVRGVRGRGGKAAGGNGRRARGRGGRRRGSSSRARIVVNV